MNPHGFNPKSLLAQIGDVGADALYGHATDLVVDTGSVWAVDARPDYGLETDSKFVRPVLLFNPDAGGMGQVVTKGGVHHTNLFSMPETLEFLKAQLG